MSTLNKSIVAGHQTLTTSWESSSRLSSYNYTRSCQRTQHPTILWSFSIWSKLERWKSSISGCLMSWPQIKKNNKNKTKLSFWNVIFSYSTQQQWTFSQSDCDVWQKVDFTWQSVMTSSVVGPRGSSKALPKAKLAPKKVMVTGGLLPIWSTTVFWVSVKPLYLRSMLSRSMRCTENGNDCSRHWSTERAQFLSTTLNHTSHNQGFLIHHIHLCVLSLQSCLTLCDPVGHSLPGSSVLGILQIRILKWVAIPLYRGSAQSRDQTQISCIAGGFFTTEPLGKSIFTWPLANWLPLL